MKTSWGKAKEIFGDALKLAPAERLLFLDKVCAENEILRREVETLLASSENVGSFMEQPAIGAAERLVSAENNLQIGESLNHYRILSRLGAGGMAAVYVNSNEPLKTKEAAQTAISLDDRLPTAHIALGDVFEKLDYDFVGAEREYKRALELDPNSASALESYGIMLTNLGKHEEGLAKLRRATEIDPLAPGVNTSYSNSLLYARRYDEAVAQYKKSLELNAYDIWAHYGLSIVYRMKGNYAESVEERAKMTEIRDGPQAAVFVRESFKKGGWQGFLRAMTGDSQAPKVSPYVLATYYAELGEKDKAFAMLNKQYENHGYLGIIKVDPRFDSLRNDPRFTDLLRRVGLPQ